jgi:cell division GTPase FtsZ
MYCYVIGSGSFLVPGGKRNVSLSRCPHPGCTHPACPSKCPGTNSASPSKEMVLDTIARMLDETDNIEITSLDMWDSPQAFCEQTGEVIRLPNPDDSSRSSRPSKDGEGIPGVFRNNDIDRRVRQNSGCTDNGSSDRSDTRSTITSPSDKNESILPIPTNTNSITTGSGCGVSEDGECKPDSKNGINETTVPNNSFCTHGVGMGNDDDESKSETNNSKTSAPIGNGDIRPLGLHGSLQYLSRDGSFAESGNRRQEHGSLQPDPILNEQGSTDSKNLSWGGDFSNPRTDGDICNSSTEGSTQSSNVFDVSDSGGIGSITKEREGRKDREGERSIEEVSEEVESHECIGTRLSNKLEETGMEDISRTLQMGIIGVGGCGNHIADAFGEIGYDVMAINLTSRDYETMPNIPNDELSRVELISTAGGAGKDPEVGAKAVREYANMLLKKIQSKFSNKEFIFVAYGLGGGTGTLGGSLVAEIAATLNIPVGVIVTLPRKNEGTDEKTNCLKGLQEVANNKNIRSIVVIDNQRVMDRLSASKGNDFWRAANREIVNLFDRFNRLSSMPTETALDAEDYKKLLNTNGFLILSSTEIKVPEGAADDASKLLSQAVEAINKGFLATGFDHKTAIRAAGVIEKPKGFDYQHSFEEGLFNVIKEDIGAGGLNRGIYTTDVKTVVVNTMIAGMRLPEQRVKELVEEASKEASEMAKKITQRNTEQIVIDVPDVAGMIAANQTIAPKNNLGGSMFRKRG